MVVPRLCEECAVRVYVRQEEIVKQPEMVDVVDVEVELELKQLEEGVPLGAELDGDVHPEALNANVVNAPTCHR